MKGKQGYIDGSRIIGNIAVSGFEMGANLTPNVGQNYDEVSTIQHFEINTRLLVDERAFRYGKAGQAITNLDLAVKNPRGQTVNFAAVAAALLGAFQVVVTVGALDGALGNGAIAANELVNGYILLYPAGLQQHMMRKILTNTAVIAGGGAMTVTLDRPLGVALGAGSNAEVLANQYQNVVQDANGEHPCVGIPQAPCSINQFIWLQTWGPGWLSPQASLGFATGQLEAVFRHDGSIQLHDATVPLAANQQHAGYVMSEARAGGQGAPFVYFQIAP
jgi:hypothetical protein